MQQQGKLFKNVVNARSLCWRKCTLFADLNTAECLGLVLRDCTGTLHGAAK